MNVYYTDIYIKIVIEYVNKIAWSRFYVFLLLCYMDNAIILRGFVCLMCHLKHFYANKDIKLSFGKVANCFMIFNEKKGEES